MKNYLQKFFSERPALSKSAFAAECGISRTTLTNAITGKKKVSASTGQIILQTAKKYGALWKV